LQSQKPKVSVLPFITTKEQLEAYVRQLQLNRAKEDEERQKKRQKEDEEIALKWREFS